MTFGSRQSLICDTTTAKEDPVSTTTTHIKKISTICVPVADQDRLIDFYEQSLGFEKRADMPFGGSYRWVEVAPPGAVTTIALAPPGPGMSTGGMMTGIALQTDDIDATYAELKQRGVDVDDQVSRMGDPVPPMFWLRDPEGNSLMVVQVD
jgi:catechol 2,3-dioxygenase-like lactoylglutathione lyase family enzyme